MAQPDRPTSSGLPEDERGVGHDAPAALPAAVEMDIDRAGELLRPVVRVMRLRTAARVPAYQTAGAAGLDLCFAPADGQGLSLLPLGRALLPTGLSVAIPAGFEGQVRPRSGLALRHGLTVLNSPGTIDSDYRGELQILLINLGAEPVAVAPGERIAQLVIAPVARAVLVEVSALSETARGAGGFGHTGRG